MASLVSVDRVRFLLNRLRERLWLKPLVVCLLSIAAVFVAKLADGTELTLWVPVITAESIESLLSVMAASMLVIATFSVTSMVSAYASAATTATPRSFTLVVADDASQNALSTFVGAFIFSVVSLTAVKNDFYETAGLFILFTLTALVFGIVIVTFVRWVDRIARLGRLVSTIEKVEQATAQALKRRKDAPNLRGVPVRSEPAGRAVFATKVGYVQHIDIAALQEWAEAAQTQIVVQALPGTFAAPGRALAAIRSRSGNQEAIDCKPVIEAFEIGSTRMFDDDPRFGLVVLSEIAGRALSSAVNDPGSAIDVIGRLLRLFTEWRTEPPDAKSGDMPTCDRVEVPQIEVQDMFNDAFNVIGRDGAGSVEVMVRLQKALSSLATLGDAEMRDAATHHAQLALKRAEDAMKMAEDLAAVRAATRFAEQPASTAKQP